MNSLLLTALLALPSVATGATQAPDAEFAAALTPLEGSTPAQWRVVWTDAPATEAVISWSTREPGESHRILYDAGGSKGDALTETMFAYRSGAYSRGEADTSSKEPAAALAYYHHVRLEDLSPSTAYRFKLESDGVASRELWFETAPADERNVSILVGGDSRTGLHQRCVINLAMAAKLATEPSVIALSHGGDFVMFGDSWSNWSQWLSHWELTTTDAGRVLPLIPTRGNHDFGSLYDEIFDNPGGQGLNYYRTELNAEASLLTLNSNISAAGDQLAWLESELDAASRDSRWIVANYHRALYPAVKTPGEAKPFWTPLFDAHGVDLALESDGHCAKRTPPIRADELHPNGVVYVGEGGLGVPQRKPRSDAWYLAPPGMATSAHHFLQLDFSAEALRLRFFEVPAPVSALDPSRFKHVIAPNSDWRYATGAALSENGALANWASPVTDDSSWLTGAAGFGYGDDDDATLLDDMKGRYKRVYLRHSFDAEQFADQESLSVMCRYDDAFVAYLNGIEVARSGVEGAINTSERAKVRSHEAYEFERFEVEGWRNLLREGDDVLAIVGLNQTRGSSDFSIDPWLAGNPIDAAAAVFDPPRVIDESTLEPRVR